MNNNKCEFHDRLTDGFIRYQYRLDNPIPKASETFEDMVLVYKSDPIFHAKVKQLVAFVMIEADKSATFLEDI